MIYAPCQDIEFLDYFLLEIKLRLEQLVQQHGLRKDLAFLVIDVAFRHEHIQSGASGVYFCLFSRCLFLNFRTRSWKELVGHQRLIILRSSMKQELPNI